MWYTECMPFEMSMQFVKCNDVNVLIVSFLHEGEDIAIAQHDFKPTNESDLPFKKGEKLKIIHE